MAAKNNNPRDRMRSAQYLGSVLKTSRLWNGWVNFVRDLAAARDCVSFRVQTVCFHCIIRAEARSSPHQSALFRPCLRPSERVPARYVPSKTPAGGAGGGFDGTKRAGTRSDSRKQGRNSADGCGEDRTSAGRRAQIECELQTFTTRVTTSSPMSSWRIPTTLSPGIIQNYTANNDVMYV